MIQGVQCCCVFVLVCSNLVCNRVVHSWFPIALFISGVRSFVSFCLFSMALLNQRRTVFIRSASLSCMFLIALRPRPDTLTPARGRDLNRQIACDRALRFRCSFGFCIHCCCQWRFSFAFAFLIAIIHQL